MTTYEKIQAKIASQQALLDKAKGEDRNFSDEEKTRFDNFQKEIGGLKSQAEIEEQLQTNNEFMNAGPQKQILPKDFGIQKPQGDDGGFENLGEFLYCVKNGDKKGRIQNFSTSDAGVMIPPQFSQEILRLSGEDEIVMPRSQNIPAGSPPDAPFSIPYFQQGDSGVTGGVDIQWTAEEQDKPDINDPVLSELTLIPKEASGIATINNKTLANWQAAGVFIQDLMRQAWVNERDMKFLRGSGAGAPLGIHNAPGAVEIARTTAATFGYVDALNMLSRLYAGTGSPVWVINQTIMPTVMTMIDPNGNFIYNGGDAKSGVPATLLGYPVLWNGKTPTLGNRADISLVKFNYFLTKMGSGPFVALSEHSRFRQNQTQFRLVVNVDGQPWVKDPLLLEDGSTRVSPYVILN